MESRRLSAQNRKQESLDGFWATLTPVQCDGIAAIAYQQMLTTHGITASKS
jgi:hypothetical protein